jgi:hypothetical protein
MIITLLRLCLGVLLPFGVDTGFTGTVESGYVQPARVATTCISDPDYCNPPPTDPIPTPYGERCRQWWPLAEAVGWPRSQLSLMGAVMNRESTCRPGAYNPVSCGRGNHAMGLMQLCGWVCPPNGCFDPESNLTAALHLWERSGWCPWVYNDNLTRHACG